MTSFLGQELVKQLGYKLMMAHGDSGLMTYTKLASMWVMHLTVCSDNIATLCVYYDGLTITTPRFPLDEKSLVFFEQQIGRMTEKLGANE